MKNIIVLLDGTLNAAMKLDARHGYSNVYKINTTLSPRDRDGNSQIILYFSGVGSHNIWKRKQGWIDYIRSISSAITSVGIEQQIVDAYTNICANYNQGDKIYIFGFSRGSAAAKVLCDLIGHFGLLKDRWIDKFSALWEIFSTDAQNRDISSFSRQYCHRGIGIEFLGLFDTVVGTVLRRHIDVRPFLKSRIVNRCVRRCIHLISIDESRKAFCHLDLEDDSDGRIVEIWTPGSHSDVGGTYHDSFICDISLLTMLWHVRCHTRLGIDRAITRSIFLSIVRDLEKMPTINKEKGFIWSISNKSNRRPTLTEREFVHPIFFHLEGALVRIGGDVRKYHSAYHKDFWSLPPYASHNKAWGVLRKHLSPYAERESANEVPFIMGAWESAARSI